MNLKKQIVLFYQNGKTILEIFKEYGVSKSAVYHQWIEKFNNSGSFKAKDNRTVEENELIVLQKELIQLRMENDILKQAALILINRQKIGIINNNEEKYSVRKMGQILKIAKSTYYYQINKCSTVDVNNYEQEVISAFKDSRKIYGARKIKAILTRKDMILSRRKIRQIMIKNQLVSKYTKLKYRNHKSVINNDEISNVLNREFNNKQPQMKLLLVI